MEKFIYRPNRIISIHTAADVSRQRRSQSRTLEGRDSFANKQDRNIFHNYQMNLYDLHKEELNTSEEQSTTSHTSMETKRFMKSKLSFGKISFAETLSTFTNELIYISTNCHFIFGFFPDHFYVELFFCDNKTDKWSQIKTILFHMRCFPLLKDFPLEKLYRQILCSL